MFQFTLLKAFNKSTKAIYTFLFIVNFFCIFRKHKIASRVPLFFRKPNFSSAMFSSIFISIRHKRIFVKILDICVKILKVQYSSHFVDLLFFGNTTITLFLKSSGIFPVVNMLLIRQYKVCLVSSLIACSNSVGMISILYAFLFQFI
jgi:hypothetical protein